MDKRYLWILAALTLSVACGDDKKDDDDDDEIVCAVDTTQAAITMGGALSITGNNVGYTAVGDQPDLIKQIVNDGCGLIGPLEGGAPLEISVVDIQDSAVVAPATVDSMKTAGVVAIVSSSTDNAQVAALTQNFLSNPVPFGTLGQGVVFNRCTTAQLNDAAVTKVHNPTAVATECFDDDGLTIRTAPDSLNTGIQAAQYILATYASTTHVGLIGRNSGNAPPVFVGMSAKLTAAGKTSTNVAFTQGTPTAQQYKDTWIPQLLANNPSSIAMVMSGAQFQNFVEGWVLYGADGAITKPSNFTTIPMVAIVQLAGTDFSPYSAAARAIIDTQVVSFQVGWDESSEGFQRWHDLWTAYYPEKTTPSAYGQMGAFDAWMVFSLAIIKAQSTVPADIGAAIYEVSNPPGTKYYANEFKEMRAALLRGEDIDYDGALAGNLDYVGIEGGIGQYIVYSYAADGTPTPSIFNAVL